MEDFIGVIRLSSFNFPPRGWLACNGQILLIQQYQALASILGNVYGGDGKTTFGIPDLRSAVPMGYDPDPVKSKTPGYFLGTASGETGVELTNALIPKHSHSVSINATDSQAAATTGQQRFIGKSAVIVSGEPAESAVFSNGSGTVNMSPQLVTNISTVAGQSAKHNNMQPFLALTYVICFEGIYPSHD